MVAVTEGRCALPPVPVESQTGTTKRPFAVWMAWSVFGWVPVAGDLIRGAAILVTWLLGTAGFGAALLSRAGIRENFAGRLIPPEALTDEYLWATPQFGVTAAKRPGSRTPTRGL